MKKFTSALLAVTALTANAFAAGAVDSKTGAYVGGHVGLANTSVKYGYVTSNSNPALDPNKVNNAKFEGGKMNPLFGLFAGYGMQVGTMYFGGEIYGGFDTAKVKPYDDSATGRTASAFYTTTVKRTNFYGLAPRIGAFITPSTMLYVKLAIEGGKWTTTIVNSPNAGNWSTAGNSSTPAANPTGTSVGPFKGSKNSISFAPGLGLDAFITKNLFLRAEYSYLFGPSMTVVQASGNNGSFSGDTNTHKIKITQQSFKVGVGYKF